MTSPFRAFIEATPEPAWVVDASRRVIEANPAAEALFGRPLLGRFVLALLPSLSEAYARADQATQSVPWSTRHSTASGCRELSGYLAPWMEDGERLGSLCVARDVTSHVQLEVQTRTTETLLRTLIDEIPDPVALRDEHGDFLLLNVAAARFYGKTPEEMVGKGDRDFGLDPAEADAIRQRRLEVMKGGKTVVLLEERHEPGTGELRHFRLIKRPFRNEGGCNRLLVVAQDVTDILRSQRKLADSERRLQDVFEVTHEGLWDWHLPSGQVLHNEQWYLLCGVTSGAANDTLDVFQNLLHPDDAPLVGERLGKLLAGEVDEYRSEHRLLTARGEIWVKDRGRVVERDARGNVVRVVGACTDVTVERRAIEELVTARRAAEASSVAKSRFLATMSHELRTPLNGILGMAQLIIASNRDAEAVEAAGTILSSGRMLLAVLNDILDLAKVEAGRLQLEAEPLEPALLVEEVQKLFSENALRSGVGLDARVALAGGASYLGDPTRLRQMLCNLVSNALKFTEVGRVTLELSAVEGGLEFAVADTGPGIPPERQAALFQPFSQVHEGPHFGGTGLGLSIVRKLAEAMGGTAGLESAVGVGTRAWFRVPLLPAKRAAAPSHAVPAALPAGLRVVAAEDNATNRKVICALLAKLGVAVETVDNGLMAVARLAGAPHLRPHLVLMDCQMPELDGLEATARVRAWEAQQGIERVPIVALTASAYEEDRKRALAAGMDDFLAKPVSLEALRAVVERWAVKRGA